MHPSFSAGRCRLVFALLLASQLAVAAQPSICTDPDETPDTCSDKITALFAGSSGGGAASVKLAEEARVTSIKKNVGPSAASTGAAATTNDFLPFFQALLGGDPASGGSESLGFELSRFLPLPSSIQHKSGVQLRGADIYAPLREALKTASLQAEVDSLQDKVAANDDILISFSLAAASKTQGRDPALHDKLFDAMLSRVSLTTLSSVLEDAYHAKLDALTRNSFDSGRLDEEGFKAVPAASRADLIAAYEEKEKATHKTLGDLRTGLRGAGFYAALDLLANNPQWSVAGELTERSGPVGPDEVAIKLQYEIGWPNLNGARKHQSCGKGDDACLAGAIPAFMNSPEFSKTKWAEPKFSLAASYARRARFSYQSTSPQFQFVQARSSSIKADVAYGQYLTSAIEAGPRLRFNVKISYEDVTDDPNRNDRGVATVTITYPLSDGLFASIGVVAATKPEYRGEVNKGFGTHAGFVYKLPGK